jgi:hypothetical protein
MARAKPAYGISDLVPKPPRGIEVQASARLDGLFRVKGFKIPEGQILDGFRQAINRASGRIAVDLKEALDGSIANDAWGDGGLVDTGALRDSGSVTINENGLTIAYDAPYASLLHYGGYIHPYGNVNLRVYLPPRPWVESVLFGGGPVPVFDFARYYTEEIIKQFR